MDNVIVPKTSIQAEVSTQTSRLNPNDVLPALKKHMLVDGLDVVMDIYKSHGPYIYDGRYGRYFIDMFSFVASNPLGMNHPKLDNPDFINYIGKIALNKPSNSDIYYAEIADFVDYFFKTAVPSYFKYVFFIEGGGLAVENALKTAFDWKVRKNFRKGYDREVGHQVIHFKQCFHGRTGYTMSLTNTDNNKTALYPKFNWPRITNPKVTFPLNENNNDEVIKKEKIAVEEIKKALFENKDDIAALIIEPIQGEGGDNHFRKEFFAQLRTLCDENEMLYIIDEVQTGIAMTGKWWAHQHFAQPDIIAFGKKTQVCGILVSERIDEIDNNVFHTPSRINSTWGGNIVDMIRFKKYLEIIIEDKLVENSATSGAHLLNMITELQNNHPAVISNARGKGLFCAIDIKDAETRSKLLAKILEKGVIMLPCGEKTIRFRPPLIITNEIIDKTIAIIDDSVKEII